MFSSQVVVRRDKAILFCTLPDLYFLRDVRSTHFRFMLQMCDKGLFAIFICDYRNVFTSIIFILLLLKNIGPIRNSSFFDLQK